MADEWQLGVSILAAPDKNACGKDKSPAKHYLGGCRNRWCVHETPLYVSDGEKLNDNNCRRNCGCCEKIRNQVGQRMAYAAGDCHKAANKPSQIGRSSARQLSVVCESFCETHRNTGAKRGRHSNLEGIP